MQIQENVQVASHLWYKLGGLVRYLISVRSEEDLLDALRFVREKAIEHVFICGTGSNLIFTDEFFDGAVIQITGHANDIVLTNANHVKAFVGVTLDEVIQFSFAHNLCGLEWAGGLPGTVGAAIRGNVGAFGGEIKDCLAYAEVVDTQDPELVVTTLSHDELQFGYRTSFIKQHKNLVVLSAVFTLQPTDGSDLQKAREVYEKNKTYRQDRHPLEYPNCGSVFKNISQKEEVEKVLSVWPDVGESVQTKWHGKVSMGYIIKRLGLSGYKVGNAQVSEKHANFIVNLGDAKASDVKTIIKKIQEKVQETFEFIPEVEVEIIT